MRLFLGFALFVASVPAFALTPITGPGCPGTLTGDTQFILTGNITNSTGSSPCIVITGITGSGYMELDCDGHSITKAITNTAAYNLYIHDNDARIWVHDCTFNGFNSQSQQTLVQTSNNAGNDPSRNFSGSGTIFSENTYLGGRVIVDSTPYYWTNNETYTNAGVYFFTSNYARVWYNVMDNSESLNQWGNVVLFQLSNYADASYNTISGTSGAAPPTGNVDDAIFFICDQNPPTVICTNATVNYNTLNDTWHTGIEFVGSWSIASITNNTINRPASAGFGCFANHSCSMDNFYIDSNSVTSYGSSTKLMEASANATYGGFFLNNYISNNTIDNTSLSSIIGLTGTPWTYWNYNTIVGNHFGSSATVYIQQASGTTDGGSNYCASASYITCH